MAVGTEIPNRRGAAKALAGAMLRPERTLTERVAALERDMDETKRRVAALEKRT